MFVPTGHRHYHGPHTAAAVCHAALCAADPSDRDKEHVWVLGVDGRCLAYVTLVSIGSLKASMIRPPEVYRVAVDRDTRGIVAVHNHPGGSPAPSEHDRTATRRLVLAGRVLDIEFIDHVILGLDTWYSFRETEPWLFNP